MKSNETKRAGDASTYRNFGRSNNNKRKWNSHRGKEQSSESARRPKHKKLEIKFDPQARREYLTSLSAKKKERRTFGLAMQKVKDRRVKLEQRREERKAKQEQIEEAERLKTEEHGKEEGFSDNDSTENYDKNLNLLEGTVTKTFQDEHTTSHFGGHVVVTTTYNLESDESEVESSHSNKHVRKKVDEAQKYAGDVKKFMEQLKGKMPPKRKTNCRVGNSFRGGKKGKHGAEGMKGMGTGKDLKLAQKALNKFRPKGGVDNSSIVGNKVGKHGKRRRR
mmetsp:Transcript_1230/g.1746  ORF Transcript_1230/g.1746 Transcript_1230/m.1746 type:complete len:278 (-) Transcript_1230:453-1286(-)